MSTTAWNHVHDLERAAPRAGRVNANTRAREEWLLERLREATAELMELRGTVQGILDSQDEPAGDIEALVEELVEKRDEALDEAEKVPDLEKQLADLREEKAALEKRLDDQVHSAEEWQKRALAAEARWARGPG